MGKEIERKFLVRGNDWRTDQFGILICQGYISSSVECTVRVRIQGEQGYLTIKGQPNGLSRLEFEYAIPVSEAQEMLDKFCTPSLVKKYRYIRECFGLKWEIDEFIGDNQGLVIAEVELRSADQTITLPNWIDREVSDDPRYLNVNLAMHPYTRW